MESDQEGKMKDALMFVCIFMPFASCQETTFPFSAHILVFLGHHNLGFDLKGHYTLGLHLAIISKVKMRCEEHGIGCVYIAVEAPGGRRGYGRVT